MLPAPVSGIYRNDEGQGDPAVADEKRDEQDEPEILAAYRELGGRRDEGYEFKSIDILPDEAAGLSQGGESKQDWYREEIRRISDGRSGRVFFEANPFPDVPPLPPHGLGFRRPGKSYLLDAIRLRLDMDWPVKVGDVVRILDTQGHARPIQGHVVDMPNGFLASTALILGHQGDRASASTWSAATSGSWSPTPRCPLMSEAKPGLPARTPGMRRMRHYNADVTGDTTDELELAALQKAAKHLPGAAGGIRDLRLRRAPPDVHADRRAGRAGQPRRAHGGKNLLSHRPALRSPRSGKGPDRRKGQEQLF